MKNFDDRWQRCAERARQAPPPDVEVPFGLATRVWALSRQESRAPASVERVWQALTWRCLALVGTALIICAAVEAPYLRDPNPLEPGIENTVAQLIWTL
jgi:hypothetical protein